MRVDVSELRYGLVVQATVYPDDETESDGRVLMLVRFRGVRAGAPQWEALQITSDAFAGEVGEITNINFPTNHSWRHA